MNIRSACRKVLVVVLLGIPAVAVAEPMIPWPWLETNRYYAWKQERDSERADWYARRALDPVGSRQRYVKGKMWPPYPRPEGMSMIPSHRFHTAHYWPHPYVCDDRASVREFVSTQEDAGWVDQTTLYSYHFDDDTQLLNRSGVLHLKWVLRAAPTHRRVLYVQTADTAQASELRMTSVRGITEEIVGLQNLPPVIPRVTSPIGRSALEVDGIQRADMSSQPVPRISPPFTTGGGGAATGP
ncbi:MAG: hypothetical protein O3B13_17145 [Planctomycetota bacterium]|nr:hypothetical protein [Planctomycetota bacterium]MDA1164822.1 hypothetical protein [Planctomycetota bacterium]